MKNTKYNKINDFLVKCSVISLCLLFISQSYLYFSNKSINTILHRISNPQGVASKEIGILPKYGELSININDIFSNDFKIILNGKDYYLKDGGVKIVVKEGDLIEIPKYNINENFVVEINDIRGNINNIDKNKVSFKENSSQIIVVNLD